MRNFFIKISLALALMSTNGLAAEGIGTTAYVLNACRANVVCTRTPNSRPDCGDQLPAGKSLLPAVMYCVGFVAAAKTGYLQTLTWQAEKRGLGTNWVNGCTNWMERTPGGEVIRIFVDYVDQHPEALSMDPFNVFVRSLLVAFPCK
jgi:hypothetical protein